MSLATLDDLGALLGVDFLESGGASGDAERADKLLEDASGAVVSYTGQRFERAVSTVRLRVPPSRWVRLGQRPVHSVDAVTDINENPLLFEWDGLDKIQVPANATAFDVEPWRSPIRTVDVTYDHGYDDIPVDIVAVVCQVAGRAFGVNAAETGINQETLGNYNYSTGAAASSGALGLLLPERTVLDRYRHGVTTVQIT